MDHNLQRQFDYWLGLLKIEISILKGKFSAQILLSNLSHLCLQVENNSDLVFSVLPAGWWIMWYFSFMHSMHFLVDGLNSLPRSMELNFMVKFLF